MAGYDTPATRKQLGKVGKPRKKRKPRSMVTQREAARLAVSHGLTYKETARLVGITTNEVMKAMREVPDDVFQEMVKTMSRALQLRSYVKAMEAMEAITVEELENATPVAKATVSAILLKNAHDKLAPTTGIARAEDNFTVEDVQKLTDSIMEKAKRLKLSGIKLEVDTSAPTPPSDGVSISGNRIDPTAPDNRSGLPASESHGGRIPDEGAHPNGEMNPLGGPKVIPGNGGP